MDIVSFFCAQAPKLKAPAKTATIMIAFKIRILFSHPFRSWLLASFLSVVTQLRNEFFRCERGYWLIVNRVPISTKSKSSIISAFRMRIQPWLSG